MVEQMTGAAIASIVMLGYILLVQAMTAAIVLLCEFIVLRVRSLWALLLNAVEKPTDSTPAPATEPYRIGGGIRRWD